MMTKDELAAYFKVTKMSIYNYMNQGMPHYKMGRAVRFELEEVKEWIRLKNKKDQGSRKEN